MLSIVQSANLQTASQMSKGEHLIFYKIPSSAGKTVFVLFSHILEEKGKVFRRVDTSLYYLLSNIYGKSPYILDMILGYLLIMLAFE